MGNRMGAHFIVPGLDQIMMGLLNISIILLWTFTINVLEVYNTYDL